MSEASKHSEKIAVALYDWLWAEFIISGQSRNKYLDAKADKPEEAQKRYDDMRSKLALPYEDDLNWAAQKDKSHQQQRVPVWVELFEETSAGDLKADFYAAQAMFAPLMTVSGSFRAQCYIEASTPVEYTFARSEAIGVDIEKPIYEQLIQRNAGRNFSSAELSFNGLKKAFDYAYGQTEAYFRGMSARLASGADESAYNSLSVTAMKKSQVSHIKLATDCVIMAAKLRKGEAEAVPFLEPVSISDQSNNTFYPLRQRVNWLADVSTS